MTPYFFTYSLGLYLTSLTTIILGWFVLFMGRRDKTSIMFSVFCFCIAGWSLLQVQMSVAHEPAKALILGKLMNLFIIFIPCFFLHFACYFSGIKRSDRKLLAICYGLCVLFSLFLPSGLLISGIRITPKVRYMISPGLLYLFSSFYFYTLAGMGLYRIYTSYKVSTGLKANQLKYVFWSSLMGFSTGPSNYLYVFGGEISWFHPYCTFGVPLYVLIMAYAMYKLRVMDINLVFRKTVIYGLIYSLCLGLFGLIIILLGHSMVQHVLNAKVFGLSMLAVLVIVLSVKPLDKLLTSITDKFLFHKKYEYHKTLKAASSGMIGIRKLDKLLKLIVNIITKHVRVKQAGIFIFDKDAGQYVSKASRGKGKIPKNYLKFNHRHPLIKYLIKNKEPIVCEELKLCLKNNSSPVLSKIISEMERLNVSVCVPSFLKGKLIGFLLLGEKLSGDMYSQEDLSLFNTLSIQAALAIENALAYEELSQTKDKLFEAEKFAAVGRLAGGIAHEIKNPLASIKTFTEYLNKRFENPEFRAKFQRIVGSEVDRINHIVEQLIFYAHPKSMDLKETALNKIIDETLSLIENDLKKENVQVKKDFACGLPHVLSDRKQLKQVFLNLFLNSVQAMHSNNGKPRQLKIATYKENGSVNISVSDTGKGIGEETKDKIFEPFFTTKENGSGLGLSIVKGIIESYKGRISVESEPGSGTTFHLNIPFN